MRTPPSSLDERPSVAPRLAAAVVALLGFLPFANWVGNRHGAPWYQALAGDWINGTAIVVGLAVVLAILSGRVSSLWREGALSAAAEWATRRPLVFGLVAAGVACAAYVVVAFRVFSRMPLNPDEVVQLYQARLYAAGHLWVPSTPTPEFFSMLNMVDAAGRHFGQFPAGGPAVLALGILVGAPWLVGPVAGAVAVLAFWFALRTAERRPAVAVGGILLFAFAPFALFMSGSYMNHVPTLMCLTIALAAMARVMAAEATLPLAAFVNGLALGGAASIRPVDALAFALPAGVWYLARALRDRARWADALAAGAGVAIPTAAVMWVNVRTTGAPLLFGYEVLWGKSHALGFHAAPWGPVHTPAHGLQLLNLYFLRLQTYLYESPMPALLPVVAALALARRATSLDRYLLASAAFLALSYFAYWHDGFYLGPRFFYPLLPVLALWTARLPALVREQLGAGPTHRGVTYAYAAAAAMSLLLLLPVRVRDYGAGLVPMRMDYGAPARSARVTNAVIFVRESWGSQLMARMWALGVSAPETELLYRSVDACRLEETITTLERDGARGPGAYSRLASFLRDSTRVVRSTISPDASERMLPGASYSARCVGRVEEDRRGFALLPPILAQPSDGNVYARDLHERNALLLQQYPGRPVYLLRPANAETGAPLRLDRLSADSLLAIGAQAPTNLPRATGTGSF